MTVSLLLMVLLMMLVLLVMVELTFVSLWVVIRVLLQWQKDEQRKAPPNNKNKAGKIYTINLNTGKPELWAHH